VLRLRWRASVDCPVYARPVCEVADHGKSDQGERRRASRRLDVQPPRRAVPLAVAVVGDAQPPRRALAVVALDVQPRRSPSPPRRGGAGILPEL